MSNPHSYSWGYLLSQDLTRLEWVSNTYNQDIVLVFNVDPENLLHIKKSYAHLGYELQIMKNRILGGKTFR